MQAEERRNSAKYRALQAAFPAVAIGAGAVGALAGGNSLMHSEATFHQIVVIFGTTFCFFLGHDMLFFPFYAIWNRPNCHNIRQTLGTWTYSVVCSCVHWCIPPAPVMGVQIFDVLSVLDTVCGII